MMTKALLALLLLPASVSAGGPTTVGGLDGKSLICEWIHDEPIVQWSGYRFDEAKVDMDDISHYGTTAVITTNYFGQYYEAPKTVSWGQSWVLDRQSLSIEATISSDVHLKLQCEVAPTRDAYYKKLESLRLELQQEIDNAMRDNKI